MADVLADSSLVEEGSGAFHPSLPPAPPPSPPPILDQLRFEVLILTFAILFGVTLLCGAVFHTVRLILIRRERLREALLLNPGIETVGLPTSDGDGTISAKGDAEDTSVKEPESVQRQPSAGSMESSMEHAME